MKSLVIAEKPSVAADLARALGKIHKHGDHYEDDHYVISYAVGHLVELEMPEDIDKKKYGFWRLETLPIIPHKFGLKPIADSRERFNALKKLLARKDLTQVINACDAGREGELIFAYLYQLTKCKLPVKRAWMLSLLKYPNVGTMVILVLSGEKLMARPPAGTTQRKRWSACAM